jgi:hypothetical protein
MNEDKTKNRQIIKGLQIDADLYYFLESISAKEDSSMEKVLSKILREKFEIETVKLEKYKKVRNELLNDTEFLQELKEKLAA